MKQKSDLRVLYLQTFPLYGSGSGTYARYLAREVNDIPHVSALVLCPEYRNLRTIPIRRLMMPFHVAFTGHPEWKDAKLYRDINNRQLAELQKKLLEQTISTVREFKPHIIHVHHAYPFSWAARFIYATYHIPYIITVHGSELPTAGADRRYRDLTIDAINNAKRIIPNSHYTKEWTLKIFGDDLRHKMRVIPGGVDVQKFKKAPPNVLAELDKEFGLAGKKVVLFAGKLTPYKGVDYLVKAAKWIKGEVIILGQGKELPKLEKIVRDQKITNVQFLGHVGSKISKLIAFYSRADVFVAPSVWDEPLGLVILESMACETPVVVTRKGGIPIAVKEGRNGLFIKAKRVKDIVEKVNYLLENDEKRIKMGKTARKIAVERFNWKKIARQFYNVYRKYMNSSEPGFKTVSAKKRL